MRQNLTYDMLEISVENAVLALHLHFRIQSLAQQSRSTSHSETGALHYLPEHVFIDKYQ